MHTIWPWTAERTAILVQGVADKMSSTQIAHELHCSRNAVIGKVHRMGLNLTGGPARTTHEIGADGAMTQRIRAKIKAKEKGANGGTVARVKRLAQAHRDDGQEQPRMPAELPADDIPLAQRKSFLDLGSKDCRFIYGDTNTADHFYCGDETLPARPYCPFHFNLCYYQQPRRNS